MSISLRNQRAAVYAFQRGGSGGRVEASFSKVVNTLAADGNWWCKFSAPTGREVTFGMQGEEPLHGVFTFGEHAPVADNGAIVFDGVEYVVQSVVQREHGHNEQTVYVTRAPGPLMLV